jgi:glycerol-3-phosphate acyltransferase
MYTFLPFGIALVVFRSIAFSFLPYSVCFPVGALTGMHYRLVAGHAPQPGRGRGGGGSLYVCNHRTLLDPIVVAAALGKAVTAVTYSLSPISEMIAPIRTAPLTRDRENDRRCWRAGTWWCAPRGPRAGRSTCSGSARSSGSSAPT